MLLFYFSIELKSSCYFWNLFRAPSREQCDIKQVPDVGPTCLSFPVCLCSISAWEGGASDPAMWVLVAAVVQGCTPGVRTEGCGQSVDGRCLQVHVSMWAKGGRCDVE